MNLSNLAARTRARRDGTWYMDEEYFAEKRAREEAARKAKKE